MMIRLFTIVSYIFILFSILFSSGVNAEPIAAKNRINCIPDIPNLDKQLCQRRGCVWDEEDNSEYYRTPQCYFPSNTGYMVKKQTENEAILVPATGSTPNPFGKNFEKLQFEHTSLGAAVKITIKPVGVERYRPPVPLKEPTIDASDALTVAISNTTETFAFQVIRASNGQDIWDTSIGGLMFADQYIQIATYLPTDKIYGFGENIHQKIKHDFTKYTTWGMLSREQPPNSDAGEGENLYGVHPFYMGLEEDGKAHGVFIFNSNPQDVTTGPAPHLVYRTIGGQLDIYYFPGPTPEDVIIQYQQVIGTPFLPAYWALGFQLCRYGYTGVDEVKDTVARLKAAGIPQDVQFADINYMDEYKDFTYDHDKWGEWPNFTDYLHSQGQKVVIIFDPTIQVEYDSFQRAIDQNVSWVSWPREDMIPRDVQDLYPSAQNTSIMLSVVWPNKHVGFPDFLDPTNATHEWWADEFKRYHKLQAFDGLWIDMNEPAVFGTNQEEPYEFDHEGHPALRNLMCPMNGPDSNLDVPPYQTMSVYVWGNSSFLAQSSLCMCGKTIRETSSIYNTKSLYGWGETIATWKALNVSTGKRGVVIGRSTFPSSGQYAGHWLGDNTARWDDLRASIISVQEFNLFGIPYVGADICGFFGNVTEELCLRWQQAGAYHSFMRNHNLHTTELQDPAQWPSVAKATRHANLFRYRHLPYLFSLHFNVSRFGGTVIRPVFFEFPSDSATYDLSYQFMWGPAVMVAPVTSPGVNAVHAYLPTDADWYSLFDTYYGNYMDAGFGFYAAPWTSISPTFLRAGYILPRQAPALTTVAARQNHFELVIGCKNDQITESGFASGELYWDDGEAWIELGAIEKHDFFHFKFDFNYTSQSATLKITAERMILNETLPTLDNIEIFGYQFIPDRNQMFINGQPTAVNMMTYSESSQILNISSPGLIDLNMGTVTLKWMNKGARNDISDSVPCVSVFSGLFITLLSLFVV